MNASDTGYPPLASLEGFPIHSRETLHVGTFGCQLGASAADAWTIWDWRCPACVTHAETVLNAAGDEMLEWLPSPGAIPLLRPLSWHIARAHHWGIGA